MNIQHSSRTDLWYTPLTILLMVKEVLGDITLDPASDEVANARVQAQYFFTKEIDGLSALWPSGTVFLNPPGGRKMNKSIAGLFWGRLMQHLTDGKLTHAIFMGFSVEQLAITQGYADKSILDFPICVPRKRIKFDSPVEEKDAPSHSNVIVYVPGVVDKTPHFVKTFSGLGKVKI